MLYEVITLQTTEKHKALSTINFIFGSRIITYSFKHNIPYKQINNKIMANNYFKEYPNKDGFFNEYGGAFIPPSYNFV